MKPDLFPFPPTLPPPPSLSRTHAFSFNTRTLETLPDVLVRLLDISASKLKRVMFCNLAVDPEWVIDWVQHPKNTARSLLLFGRLQWTELSVTAGCVCPLSLSLTAVPQTNFGKCLKGSRMKKTLLPWIYWKITSQSWPKMCDRSKCPQSYIHFGHWNGS